MISASHNLWWSKYLAIPAPVTEGTVLVCGAGGGEEALLETEKLAIHNTLLCEPTDIQSSVKILHARLK